MKDFAKFLADNREAVRKHIRSRDAYNANGDATISRDDPWFYEDEWDEYSKELIARENNPPARSMVR